MTVRALRLRNSWRWILPIVGSDAFDRAILGNYLRPILLNFRMHFGKLVAALSAGESFEPDEHIQRR